MISTLFDLLRALNRAGTESWCSVFKQNKTNQCFPGSGAGSNGFGNRFRDRNRGTAKNSEPILERFPEPRKSGTALEPEPRNRQEKWNRENTGANAKFYNFNFIFVDLIVYLSSMNVLLIASIAIMHFWALAAGYCIRTPEIQVETGDGCRQTQTVKCISRIRYRDMLPAGLWQDVQVLWARISSPEGSDTEKRSCNNAYCTTHRCTDNAGNDIFVVSGCGEVGQPKCGYDLLRLYCKGGSMQCNSANDVCSANDYCNARNTDLQTPNPAALNKRGAAKPSPPFTFTIVVLLMLLMV
uniref:Uncharacterized protein n=1 Tax=Globodera pallida TaxID=36090 RepID=A0A183C8V6_GLOPA